MGISSVAAEERRRRTTMPCSTLSRPSFLLAFIALMAFVKAATAGEQENPYIVIKPSKDSARSNQTPPHVWRVIRTLVEEAKNKQKKGERPLFYTTRFGRRKKNNDLHSVEDLLATLKANNAGNKLMAVVAHTKKGSDVLPRPSCLLLSVDYTA